MIQTNTEQYKKNYIAFHEAVKAFIAKNGRQSINQGNIKQILKQGETKFHLKVDWKKNTIVPPSKTIPRPAPQAKPKTQARPTARPMKAFWMP